MKFDDMDDDSKVVTKEVVEAFVSLLPLVYKIKAVGPVGLKLIDQLLDAVYVDNLPQQELTGVFLKTLADSGYNFN